ncbi:hypothetical protein MEZE111188_11230 [Mesobacillus zeae]
MPCCHFSIKTGHFFVHLMCKGRILYRWQAFVDVEPVTHIVSSIKEALEKVLFPVTVGLFPVRNRLFPVKVQIFPITINIFLLDVILSHLSFSMEKQTLFFMRKAAALSLENGRFF